MAAINDTELFKVPGLVAVITGGGTGIGLMMAKALSANGAKKVFIVGRRLEKLEEAAKDHDNIIPVQGDVTSKDSLAKVADRVKAEAGYVNLLAINSGTSGPMMDGIPQNPSISQLQQSFWNWSAESINNVFALNNTAAFFTATAFLELLDAGNKPGNGPDYQTQILFTSSLAGLSRNYSTGIAYATSKAGTVHMAKALATYLAPYSIRVNTLAPGIFPSEMTQGHIGASAGFSQSTIPAGRVGSDEDIRGTILWLAGRAGAYINGMVVLVDGGRLSLQPSTY
ncbi:hypothetical protein LTR36_007406 [Oleoguttula mirabilis]|uniref:NAD(P)-binding protein n=1 Tax=Oleoguttula mirabilis TaxID=1507867 RepID=A0AAV9J9B1_9PEZI|nr:hypothetical protein LTR36_007406 [Oleoguttula mirabilis]